MTYPIVIVRWVDSQSFGGWRDTADAKELVAQGDRLNCTSTGFLFHESKDAITLIQSVGKSQVVDGITIPRRAIKSIKRIKT